MIDVIEDPWFDWKTDARHRASDHAGVVRGNGLLSSSWAECKPEIRTPQLRGGIRDDLFDFMSDATHETVDIQICLA